MPRALLRVYTLTEPSRPPRALGVRTQGGDWGSADEGEDAFTLENGPGGLLETPPLEHAVRSPIIEKRTRVRRMSFLLNQFFRGGIGHRRDLYAPQERVDYRRGPVPNPNCPLERIKRVVGTRTLADPAEPARPSGRRRRGRMPHSSKPSLVVSAGRSIVFTGATFAALFGCLQRLGERRRRTRLPSRRADSGLDETSCVRRSARHVAEFPRRLRPESSHIPAAHGGKAREAVEEGSRRIERPRGFANRRLHGE